MPAIVRLSKKELVDLIESTEAASCDAACLRGLLAEVEEEEDLRRPPKRVIPPKTWPAEPTAQERLEVEIGHLFPAGVTDEVMEKLIEFDLNYSLKQLREMCIEAGLSPSGHKKELAAKLIARQA
ncbi:hypothetical protein ES703_08026 [subsurface metagenome]